MQTAALYEANENPRLLATVEETVESLLREKLSAVSRNLTLPTDVVHYEKFL